MQRKKIENPKIALLNIELELKSEKVIQVLQILMRFGEVKFGEVKFGDIRWRLLTWLFFFTQILLAFKWNELTWVTLANALYPFLFSLGKRGSASG